MASTPKRLPSGSWRTVVRLPNGSRKSITDPVKAVVVSKARELESAADRGDVLPRWDRRLTVAAWHDSWVKRRNIEPVTVRKESSVLRVHVLPRWGTWPLRSISRGDVQEWITDLTRTGLAGSYVGTIYRTFVKLMGDAVEDGKIPASPCRKIELPRETRPTPRWLTREEYGRIQLALDGEPHAAIWQALVGVGCFVGLRPGELAGLDVGYIDFRRQLIRVEQVMTPKGLRAYPKTDDSLRSVPFPDEVGQLLWAAVADRADDEPAFPAALGGRVWWSNWAVGVWAPALRRAGVRPARPYIMRHTAASWMVQDGLPKEDIADMLGHAGERLVKLYAHLGPHAHDRIRAVWASRSADPRMAHGLEDAPDPGGSFAGQGR